MFEELTSIDLGESRANTFKIHPSVLVNILNVYYRNTKKDFLLGILLGKTFPDYVSVTNMIFVSHSKKEDGSIDLMTEPAMKILDYMSLVYNETKVGWFITKPSMDREVAGIHKHMASLLKSSTANWAGPLCLLIDASLEDGKIHTRGYTPQTNKLYRDLFVMFQPATVRVEMPAEDTLAMNGILYDALDPEQVFNEKGNASDFDNYVDSTLVKLEELKKNFESVDEKTLHKHPEIIRQITNLLNLRLPSSSIEQEQLGGRFKENNMLIKYHAKLVETQLLLSEKLCASIKLSK